MTVNRKVQTEMISVMQHYSAAFGGKIHSEASEETDLLMDAFGITAEVKNANRQYWGRELGMCWQRLVIAVMRNLAADKFAEAQRYGNDEPYDLAVGRFAIDTKYRVGSGDAGTLKKFKQYGELLIAEDLRPMMLFLRSDNLPAAIGAMRTGGWIILTGDESFDWIASHTDGFRLDEWLREHRSAFRS